jgi:hypothetical protein
VVPCVQYFERRETNAFFIIRALGNADFQPSSGLTVLFLCEADYVGGARLFKQKVARFYSSRAKMQAIVVCQKTQMTSLDFLTVQEFVVIELGLALIPITDQVYIKSKCNIY